MAVCSQKVSSFLKRAAVVAVGVAAVFAAGGARAATRYWTGAGANANASTAANWLTDKDDPSTTGAPAAGDDVVLDGATDKAQKAMTWDLNVALGSWTQNGYTNVVTVQTKYGSTGFTCLTVNGNVNLQSGSWTHTANSNAETYRLNVACGGDFTVGANAVLDAVGKGYSNGGPGKSNSHSGGTHGGYCTSVNSVTVHGVCYGSVASPVNLGSSGPGNYPGGGAILLTVTGTLTVDGLVTAKGKPNSPYTGAGGSVWLTAAKIQGAATGMITADGAISWYGDYFGCGGRVSLCQTGDATDFSAYQGAVTCHGSMYNSVYCGSPGTIYYEVAGDGRGGGALVVEGNAGSGNRSDFYIAGQDAGFSPKSITLKGGATLNVFGDGSGVKQTFSFGKLVMDGDGTLAVSKDVTLDIRGLKTEMSDEGTHTISLGTGTKVLCDAKMTLDGLTMKFAGTDVDWSLDELVCTNRGGIAVRAASTLDVDTLRLAKDSVCTSDAALEITGDVTMEDGAFVTHTVNTKDTDYRVDWTVGGDMTIASGAVVSACAKGFPYGIGPGADTGAWKAGSHGGRGRTSTGVCYGSLTKPVTFGAGMSHDKLYGGGGVKITVTGDLVNNGRIDADGDREVAFNRSTSAGGSVWVTAATLSGSGCIEANAYPFGKTATVTHAGSGGGRVAVWLTQAGADFSGFTGPITAFAGVVSGTAGGAGTVYLKKGSEADDGGTLVITNGTSDASLATEISAKVTDLAVGSVLVGSNASLSLSDGKVLSVSGDITMDGPIQFSADSGLSLVGTRSCAISGSLSLGIFDCLAAGKTITFAAGSTLTVAEGGRFSVEGTQAQPVTLKSSEDESAWYLAVGSSASVSVNAGAVSDCDASGGQQINAVNSTLTRTTNWTNTEVVYGQLLTWTGASGDPSWLVAANWDAARAPLSTDRIRIPATAVQPVLATDIASLDLTVEAGASLDLAEHNYTVTDKLALNGTITSSGTPVVTVGGDCSLTGGAFEGDGLTLTLSGGAERIQYFGPGGTEVPHLVLNPGVGGLTVTQGVVAAYLTVNAPAARTVAFAPGITVKARVDARFVSSESNLTLASTTAGQAWNLSVPCQVSATGVTVSDSTVSGTVVLAEDSTDDGRNVNWDFGTITPFHWTASATPPAETDIAYVDSVLTASASAIKARKLTFRKGAVFSLPKTATLNVTEGIFVEDGATVTLDGKVTAGGNFQIASGGTVTHSQSLNTTTVYTLDLTVGGDLVVEAGGAIDLTGKGYALNVGPGTNGGGGSHAGRGQNHGAVLETFNYTYGSAIWPVNPGSGGAQSAGGGAAKLVVAGSAYVNGTITTTGANSGAHWSGSGGSVALRAAALVGTGTISANGGDVASAYVGAGGRIAVILTGTGEKVSRFTGSIQAYSGRISTDAVPVPVGSAGTVYFEEATDESGKGRVIVDNSVNGADSSGSGYDGCKARTDYPVTNDKTVPEDESKNITWTLKNYVALNVTKDAKIGNLFVEGARPKIYLNGHILKVNATHHKLGTNESVQIIPGGTAENPGRIIWKQGFAIIVR